MMNIGFGPIGPRPPMFGGPGQGGPQRPGDPHPHHHGHRHAGGPQRPGDPQGLSGYFFGMQAAASIQDFISG